MAKVALLTNFMEFNPGYSLTGIVKDQARMLTKFGHEVHLFVNDQYHGEEFSGDVVLEKKIPFSHLIDYKSKNDITADHKLIIQNTAAMLRKELSQGYDFAFTHDFIFTGWFLPYGLGCQTASPDLPNVRWMHWIHSVPTAGSDWWVIKAYGPGHKIIFPNSTERTRVAEAYRGEIEDVRVIHHIKDLRSWYDFCEDTCEFIDLFPGVMQADIVKVYPASTDRLRAKGVREVIKIFKYFKEMGFSVCLVIANQWATGRQRKEDVETYYKIASRNGLRRDEEFIFTSEWKEKYATGIPQRMVRELYQCSSLFIFPTREETFGLAAPEASLAGVFMVLNKSLQMMLEIHGMTGLYFDFGSFHMNHNVENEDRYYRDVAQIIAGRMREDEIVANKTFVRQHYNYDTLYHKEYGPVMAEARTWI